MQSSSVEVVKLLFADVAYTVVQAAVVVVAFVVFAIQVAVAAVVSAVALILV